MRVYKDGLGHKYEVPDNRIEEFERKRAIALAIAIIGKIIVIGWLVYAFTLY